MMKSQSIKPNEQELIVPLPRRTLNPPIPVQQLKTKEGAAKFFGYAVNISREGIFVPTMNPKPVGFKTQVRFELTKSKILIEGEVEVVWCREYDPRQRDRPAGMGIKFLDLPEDKKRLIDAFLTT